MSTRPTQPTTQSYRSKFLAGQREQTDPRRAARNRPTNRKGGSGPTETDTEADRQTDRQTERHPSADRFVAGCASVYNAIVHGTHMRERDTERETDQIGSMAGNFVDGCAWCISMDDGQTLDGWMDGWMEQPSHCN